MNNTEMTLAYEAKSSLEIASNLQVNSMEEYELAGNARKEIKNVLKNIKAYWEPKKDQAFQLHKSLVAAEKEMISPLEQADKLIDQTMSTWRREQDRIRQEAEREQRRLAEEARKAEEEARRLLEEASQKDELDEDDVAILQMAQTDLHNASLLADVPVIPEAVKMQGISVTRTWKARVINDALVPVTVGRILLRPIDMSELNKLAKAGIEVPGVEFYQEESTRVRL